MLPALLLNVVQSLVLDQAQSLAKEHVADAIERNLDEDQKKMLDDVVDMMPDNQFKTFKEFIGWLCALNVGQIHVHVTTIYETK